MFSPSVLSTEQPLHFLPKVHNSSARPKTSREPRTLQSTRELFIQPEDELILAVLLEDDDLEELNTFLRKQSAIEAVRESGMAFDHAFDPHKVIEAARYAHLHLKLGHVAMETGKAAVTATVSAAVKGWVDRRNERKQKAIQAKETEPLLFDQYGHRLDIRPESKKRKR